MRTAVRVLGTALAAVLFSGCGLAWMWNEVPHRAPEATPTTTPYTPPPDERALHPYTGEVAKGAECVRATTDVLADAEAVAMVGGAITYPRGAMVKANANWWTVAVAAQVNPNNEGLTSKDVDPYTYFVTNAPTLGKGEWDSQLFSWQLSTEDAATARALACLKRIPVPKPKPPAGSPETYAGKLAKGAKCKAVSAKMLDRLEEVGQVGGAITYPRGAMVKANAKWWTVAVATQVNPNSSGLTRENVPATALFVTNDPSYSASSKARIVYFPIKAAKKDTAAAKALSCL